jgi:ERCC4-related helicase
MTDPYVLQLIERNRAGDDCSAALEKVLFRRKTYCLEQLKSLLNKAMAMSEEIGPLPAEWYLNQCINKFDAMTRTPDSHLLDWSTKEKHHLAALLRAMVPLNTAKRSSIPLEGLSPKVERLIDVLLSEVDAQFTGLIFVEQRAWVAALGDILASHPRTRGLFKIGTFVGTSNSSKRKSNVADFTEPRNQLDTLEHFRTGQINLVLATSVLEEGIDIPSCHLVICFERPKNLKSFIQRRGRARKEKSKLILFTSETDKNSSPAVWESLEEEMKEVYLNDLREAELAEEREREPEEGDLFYRVPTTGYV